MEHRKQGWPPKTKPWRGHPFNRANNVNGVNGDPNGDDEGTETHTLQVPEITALQESYVRKVVATLNDLDNVLWEISNESNGASKEWQYHMINFLKRCEADQPKQHPVGMTFCFPGGENTDLFDSPADWISPNSTRKDDYCENPPAGDGRKVIISDTDHLWGVGGDRAWVWKSFTRGLNPIFMDPLEMPRWESVRQAMGIDLGLCGSNGPVRYETSGGLGLERILSGQSGRRIHGLCAARGSVARIPALLSSLEATDQEYPASFQKPKSLSIFHLIRQSFVSSGSILAAVRLRRPLRQGRHKSFFHSAIQGRRCFVCAKGILRLRPGTGNASSPEPELD